eukprot:TRINITY_DN4327_c0_g1_i3.p1 TRINITY_DN4327_c0_g1~~TRINITY_DN4327_c0_g1_i3.p1  ORF type:complete len:444 (+),score=76.13 TRINITY_DN4327_c0_g1_i3:67-1398(+)
MSQDQGSDEGKGTGIQHEIDESQLDLSKDSGSEFQSRRRQQHSSLVIIRPESQTLSPQISPIARRNSSYHRKDMSEYANQARCLGPNDFVRLQLLGKGDVGRVYLVKEKLSGELFAMKVLHKKELLKRKKVDRVMTERHILGTLNHPFLISMYHAFQSEDLLFFIITYCPGGEFFRALQNLPRRCLPESAVKFYSAEVVLALEYLHMQGVVYRDLKPENILLSEDGHIKLADFDLSKSVIDADAHVPRLTNTRGFWGRLFRVNTMPVMKRTNSFVGTEEYIAPEVILGQGHDTTVDWWTLGILIYEMTFGKTPFRGVSRDETFSMITTRDVEFPRLTEASSECKNIIKKLLSKQMRRRLGSTFGASEIKDHPFYSDIKWALIRNMKAPIRPKISHPYDTSNFSYVEDSTPLELDRERLIEDILDPHGAFTRFSFHKKGHQSSC